MIELCGWANGRSVNRTHGVKAVAWPDGDVTSACAPISPGFEPCGGWGGAERCHYFSESLILASIVI